MSKIRIALDIGSSKIACIIFETSSRGEVKGILGHAVKASTGVRCGIIENPTAVAAVVASTVYEAEKQASLNVKKAIVSLSHPNILSKVIATKLNLKGRQVSKNDIKDVGSKNLLKEVLPNYLAVHEFQICYDVDTQQGIHDPEFMFANTLTSYSACLAIPKEYLQTVTKCINRAHITPEHFVLSSYASSLSMAPNDLKDFVLVDIGAGTSDVIVFDANTTPIWAGCVPLGSDNITKDICNCFEVNFEAAERLKILYGRLGRFDGKLHDNNIPLEDKIDTAMLNKIITARTEEIIEMVLNKIPLEYRLNKLVLTGGGTKLLGMEHFVAETFNCHATTTEPVGNHGPENFLGNNPAFSTCLGLMKFYSMELSKKPHLSFKKILHWMWESF